MSSSKERQNQGSAFESGGMASHVDALKQEVADLYTSDEVPWVIGYSGGKDSTAVLQLVWIAVSELPPKKRRKPIHVISTDTLVENPVVASWVNHSLAVMGETASKQKMPISSHRLTPRVKDSYWVNLIGKGYPAPSHKFRWCTERLKISPSNNFIREMVAKHGETILVLGTRKAESARRARVMERLEVQRIREGLSPNAALPNSLVYSPIEAWTNDDVWLFLMQYQNPWGYENKDLLTMYQGASPDGECPLVIDTTTPSCGDSRFGCWVCTLVDKDRSMQAMIQNDTDKEWMLPLLELRDKLDADDRQYRDFRRMSGQVQLFHGRPIPGPYTQEAREMWLRDLLEAQKWVREHGPVEARAMALITQEELEEIRRIWVIEKHEFEDRLPVVYRAVCGEDFPGEPLDEDLPLGPLEMRVLREVTDDRLHKELVRDLLDVERRYRFQARRAGLLEDLESVIKKYFYEDVEDAIKRAQQRRQDKTPLSEREEVVADGHGDTKGKNKAGKKVEQFDLGDEFIQPRRTPGAGIGGSH